MRKDIGQVVIKLDHLQLKQEPEHEVRASLADDINDNLIQENVAIHNKIDEVCIKLQEIRQVTGAR